MENTCPVCGKALSWNNGVYEFQRCDKAFVKQGFCLTCDAKVERLQACGATSYFCHSCNELKSRSSVKTVFEEQKTVS